MAVQIKAVSLAVLLLLMAACNGSGSGGGGSAIPNDSSSCTEPGCDRENEPPANSPLICNGIQGATCPQGYHCVDDNTDTCDPATGADCGGICILGTELPSCGGFGGQPCAAGYACVDDPADSCEGGPAVDCPGLCAPETDAECYDNDDCPQLDALCSYCADGKISCPLSRCDGGKCLIAVEACPPASTCGGIAGLPCDPGFECVDDPNDLCDPRNGGADCGGVCIPANEPAPCGEFGGMVCPDGFVCVDDPNDDCRPDAAGADCPALCEPKRGECTGDADCPLLRVPCPICPDGTSACGSSTCDHGVCNVSFPTCPSPVTCGDDAQPCKPGDVCVDDPSDSCDPMSSDTPCPGICKDEEPRLCGGPGGDNCPPGFSCFYDTPDGCWPDPTGTTCGGICQPDPMRECNSDDECPRIAAPCKECPDGSAACPTSFCANGICSAAFEGCPDPGFCGGIAGFPCPPGFTCVDQPNDDCDPEQGGADCGGTCVREETPRSCGGFAGETCPPGYDCADVAGDDCDPEQGGADCPGSCRPADPAACKDDSDCPMLGAPCQICADGAVACPTSSCVNGGCQINFDRCAPAES